MRDSGDGGKTLLAGGRVLLERDVGVTASDGIRLSCDVYRPNRPGRFPALLEHIPYRKDDLRMWQDRSQNIFLVERGLACVRLDVRGTGNSQGVALDEYTPEEQRDGYEAVDWISRQPWCSGRVGSWGKSYGGFSCIQLAALAPPALGAIAPVYATDDRYTDDMHFDGGALCAFELSNYPIRMIAMNALPPLGRPDRSFMRRWLKRIDDTPPWILRWMREQRDSPYWRNGSLRPAYERIQCPVFIVAGWRDGYRTAGLRMAANLKVPWQLLAGPWTHIAPDRGRPGPAYPFMEELAQFFLRHLGEARGAGSKRPRTVFYQAEFDPPTRPTATASGRWLASDSWPDQTGPAATLHFNAAGVLSGAESREAAEVTCPFNPAVGVMNGNWCPPPPETGLPADQRADDARSATFTTEPLQQPLDTLGIPRVWLSLSHPGPNAIVSVKLSDVSALGESQLVTRGVLNLAHRQSHEAPEPLEGSPVQVEVPLQATGWRFGTGHRIRVAVSGADWPVAWPLPTHDPVVIRLGEGAPGWLELPALPADARTFVPPGPPADLLEAGGGTQREGRSRWRIVTDPVRGMSGIEAADLWQGEYPEEGLQASEAHRYEAMTSESDPLAARVVGRTALRVTRPGLAVEARAQGTFTSSEEEFSVDLKLELRSAGKVLRRKRWRERIPRRLC